MLQIIFFLTFESFYTIFVAAFVYLELVCQLEATNRLNKHFRKPGSRRHIGLFVYIRVSYPADAIYHLIDSGYGANQIAAFVIDGA